MASTVPQETSFWIQWRTHSSPHMLYDGVVSSVQRLVRAARSFDKQIDKQLLGVDTVLVPKTFKLLSRTTKQKNPMADVPPSIQPLLDNNELLYSTLRLCSQREQQAAYTACKAMRDVCNQNIKSVESKIEMMSTVHDGAFTQTVNQIISSSNLCPDGALNITNMSVVCKPAPHRLIPSMKPAFVYLEKLLDAQAARDVRNNSKQLSSVRTLSVSLCEDESNESDVPGALNAAHKCTVKLLQLLPNVTRIEAKTTTALLTAVTQVSKLEGLSLGRTCSYRLHRIPYLFPNLNELDIKLVDTDSSFPPCLSQLTNLNKLCLSISASNGIKPESWAPLAALQKLHDLSIHLAPWQVKCFLSARYIAGVTQLQKLSLFNCSILQPFMLAGMPCITHFAWGGWEGRVHDNGEPSKEHDRHEGRWPALQKIRLMEHVAESDLRALLLPRPHTALTVIIPAQDFNYKVDEAADQQSGFLGVAYLEEAQYQSAMLYSTFSHSALGMMRQHERSKQVFPHQRLQRAT